MAHHQEKTGDIVIDTFEQGIAVSPHKGIANIQNANISTESTEVMCSFSRVQQSQPNTGGTLTRVGAFTASSSVTLLAGSWITITSAGISGLSNGSTYYVVGNAINGNLSFNTTYTINANTVQALGAGSCTYVIFAPLTQPVASATESYTDSNNSSQFRYYILDSEGKVWISDTSSASVDSSITLPLWFLPYTNTVTSYGAGVTNVSGIGILNGWLFVFGGNRIFCKPTATLDYSWSDTVFSNGTTMGLLNNILPHNVLSSHSGFLYYTDGNYVGSIQPTNAVSNGLGINIQSYSRYTSTSTTGTIATIISESLPTPSTVTSTTRVPAFFFASKGGNVATSLGGGQIQDNTLYFIDYSPGLSTSGNFNVYNALTTGSALDITTGATGTQYFNTFSPSGTVTVTAGLMVFAPQALRLPFFEIAQCLAESSSTILVGCRSNAIYLWNQLTLIPSDIIPLPESNTTAMVNVNNMTYILAGNRGNIYVTNGSTASLVTTVPDYCAGVPGTPNSYIEPYFVWGAIMYLRGRVYFSLLDQTATKAGNCGGVWSFVPTQNFFIGQDTGLSVRLENQNSYGTYNGVATVLLPSQSQNVRSPQYWAGWYSSISSPTYGIDFTNTTPSTVAIVETDLVPTGTLLNKRTLGQIEYKLATPLISGETVTINYRLNGTDAWATCGSVIEESLTDLSGYFVANFQNTQWVQFQVILTPVATSSSSFVRLSELRIR